MTSWSIDIHVTCVCRFGGEVVRGIDATVPVMRGISKYMLRLITMSTVVVVFFFYPSAVQALLEIFDCDSVDTGTASNPLMVRVFH